MSKLLKKYKVNETNSAFVAALSANELEEDSEKKEKWMYKRLNWQEHVNQLMHTEDSDKSFSRRYHMTLSTFNKRINKCRINFE